MNIDALLGETGDRTLTYKGEDFILPSEIPGECLAPFLADDLGLADLFIEAFKDADGSKPVMDVVFETLRARPRLPLELLAAVKEAFRILLGDSYEPLMAKRPGLNFYWAFATALPDEYGLDFGGFFASSESSEASGTTSPETSPTTTPDSTLGTSGDTPTLTEASDVEPSPAVAPEPEPASD